MTVTESDLLADVGLARITAIVSVETAAKLAARAEEYNKRLVNYKITVDTIVGEIIDHWASGESEPAAGKPILQLT